MTTEYWTMANKYENITNLWNWACMQEQSPTAFDLKQLIAGETYAPYLINNTLNLIK